MSTTQMSDPRIASAFNCIALDMRGQGSSRTDYDPRHDTWVQAADTALALAKLGTGPVHVFAVQTLSVYTALSFAIL